MRCDKKQSQNLSRKEVRIQRIKDENIMVEVVAARLAALCNSMDSESTDLKLAEALLLAS